jgi:CubicO group peptidase (beta-lactamase class C family)
MSNVSPPHSPSLAPAPATGPSLSDTELIARLSRFVDRGRTAIGVPGVSIAVSRRGELIWAGAFGYADLARGTPMRPDHAFGVGSMSKIYVSVAFMQLAEQGLVDLDEPIAPHLGFALDNPFGERPITARDLMTFRSGLVTDTGIMINGRPDPLADFLRAELAHEGTNDYNRSMPKWSAPVGARYQYSNIGFALVALAVERANPEDLSFSDYIRRNVLGPLGMRDSDFPEHRAAATGASGVLGRTVTGHVKAGRAHLPTPGLNSALYGATGLLATPTDHLKMLDALRAEGRCADGGRLLEAASVEEILRPQQTFGDIPLDEAPNALGLGIRVGERGTPREAYGFSGCDYFSAFSSCLSFTNHDLAVAFAINEWDLVAWRRRRADPLSALITDYVGALVADPDGAVAARPRSADDPSYTMGLLMGERYTGLLGIQDPTLSDAMAACAAEGLFDDHGQPAGYLDLDAFREGFDRAAAAGGTRQALGALLEPGALALPAAELPLAFAEIGSEGVPPFPFTDFWSHI